MLRVAQLVHPALNLTLEKHNDATLANKRFLFAIATRFIDYCHSRFPRIFRGLWLFFRRP
ncbi:hypothetical protein CA603_00165 [Paraburkholderia hospita]|nr:hypothetical protein CA603_00165 [Paraburkholderia hospita]